MTIEEGLPRRRHRVAWLENTVPPPAETAFVERGFTVSRCTTQELRDPAYLNGVAAVVFTQPPAKLNVVARALQDHGARLLNHGCHVLVRPVANGLPLVTGVGSGNSVAAIPETLWLPASC